MNDSKLIGMCIYNTVILAVVVGILTLAITNNVQLEYLIVSLFYIMGATLTQFIIFVPKVICLINQSFQFTFSSCLDAVILSVIPI